MMCVNYCLHLKPLTRWSLLVDSKNRMMRVWKWKTEISWNYILKWAPLLGRIPSITRPISYRPISYNLSPLPTANCWCVKYTKLTFLKPLNALFKTLASAVHFHPSYDFSWLSTPSSAIVDEPHGCWFLHKRILVSLVSSVGFIAKEWIHVTLLGKVVTSYSTVYLRGWVAAQIKYSTGIGCYIPCALCCPQAMWEISESLMNSENTCCLCVLWTNMCFHLDASVCYVN